ncbi:MAG: hypothetical protein M1541_00540 [Acidobacteria bacterium]|nr:hypothetical protein [Acidobacteriota bacterium]
MRSYLAATVLSLLVLPAFAVDGTITNGTTGKPQDGVTVTLFKLGQAGPEALESVKTDAQGKFQMKQDAEGPRFLQAAFEGVTYSQMLPPGTPATGVAIEVYDASKKPGTAAVAQRMMVFEPSGGQMIVNESYIFRNDGKVSYFDPAAGTLQFYLPEAAKGIVQVNATAPNSVALQETAEKTSKPNIYKIAFPIRPGETRIDLTYLVPFQSGGAFEGKSLYKGGPTRLVAPSGVTIQGAGVQAVGQEPTTQATIYDVKGADFKVQITGSGSLRQQQQADTGSDDNSGPSLEQVMPKLFAYVDGSAGLIPKVLAVKWILLPALMILMLGFILLYRAEVPGRPAALKDENARRRR